MKVPGRQYAYHTSDYQLYKKRIELAKGNRKNPTPAEALLWEQLKGRRLGGYKFRRQHVTGRYIVDFACLQKLLVVEVDGEIHNEGEQPQIDRNREADLRALGFTIVRFSNEEVMGDIEDVCASILDALRSLPNA
ncbi:MAG: endonuclease domain-containing protein [Chitinophagaceae bacterium]|nr:MAG: endonuclease domain-containing protein [Chitinophagaceae bacterium]